MDDGPDQQEPGPVTAGLSSLSGPDNKQEVAPEYPPPDPITASKLKNNPMLKWIGILGTVGFSLLIIHQDFRGAA